MAIKVDGDAQAHIRNCTIRPSSSYAMGIQVWGGDLVWRNTTVDGKCAYGVVVTAEGTADMAGGQVVSEGKLKDMGAAVYASNKGELTCSEVEIKGSGEGKNAAELWGAGTWAKLKSCKLQGDFCGLVAQNGATAKVCQASAMSRQRTVSFRSQYVCCLAWRIHKALALYCHTTV